VLHIVEPPAVVYGGGIVSPKTEEHWEELRAKLRQLRPEDPKVHVEHLLVEGDPVAQILRGATETNCDLIVMGTHGRTGLSRLLMGSVAEGVIRKAACPVLTVKMPFPDAPSFEEVSSPKTGANEGGR
jgi:nucleotide-binding universal stress UspA family protein